MNIPLTVFPPETQSIRQLPNSPFLLCDTWHVLYAVNTLTGEKQTLKGLHNTRIICGNQSPAACFFKGTDKGRAKIIIGTFEHSFSEAYRKTLTDTIAFTFAEPAFSDHDSFLFFPSDHMISRIRLKDHTAAQIYGTAGHSIVSSIALRDDRLTAIVSEHSKDRTKADLVILHHCFPDRPEQEVYPLYSICSDSQYQDELTGFELFSVRDDEYILVFKNSLTELYSISLSQSIPKGRKMVSYCSQSLLSSALSPDHAFLAIPLHDRSANVKLMNQVRIVNLRTMKESVFNGQSPIISVSWIRTEEQKNTLLICHSNGIGTWMENEESEDDGFADQSER